LRRPPAQLVIIQLMRIEGQLHRVNLVTL